LPSVIATAFSKRSPSVKKRAFQRKESFFFVNNGHWPYIHNEPMEKNECGVEIRPVKTENVCGFDDFVKSLQSENEHDSEKCPSKGVSLLGSVAHWDSPLSELFQRLIDCSECRQIFLKKWHGRPETLQAEIDRWKSLGCPRIEWPEWVQEIYSDHFRQSTIQ
jgi:hypothetical protein